MQSEYPDQGTRHGPQFFSFVGDDFLKKPATSEKFEHLRTKWFYSQFGDASGTGGRTQDVIPLQDWDGRIIRGSEDAGKKLDKGKGKATQSDDSDEFNNTTSRQGGGNGQHIDLTTLAESLQSATSIAELNNAQVSQLTESHLHDHDTLHRQQEQSDRDAERLQRVEALMEENAQQLQSLSKSHIKAQQQNRELAEQNARILREMKRQRAQAQTLLEKVATAAAAVGPAGGERDKEAGEIEALHVVVHPPPRKIDRPLVGYAYHTSAVENGGAALNDSPAKSNHSVKKPGLGNRTTSSGVLKSATSK